jgi:Protein of unknown function (DUF1573)
MKKFLFLASAFVIGISAMAQAKAEDVLKASTEKHDFGKIKQGVPVTTYFDLTNTSDKPLVIENAWGSCGCTTPEWSKEPIAPKGTTRIKVGYNAANAAPFTKDVYVKLAGVQNPYDLKITGTVLPTAEWDAYTKSDEYKKAEKDKAQQEAKEAKAEKKAAKKAKKDAK